jgi:lambda repressor-like predicted transcriptional regulator
MGKITVKNWPPEKIQKELLRANGWRYGAQAIIARDLGLKCSSNVSRCINDGRASDRIRRAIAAFIGVPVEAIWPNEYADGKARGPGRPRAEHQKENKNTSAY